RSSGRSTSAALKRLYSETTFKVPSSRRTAHAQAFGPWTRTPFASAIPPSLSFSSAIAKSLAAGPGLAERHTSGTAASPTRAKFVDTLKGVGREVGYPEVDAST